MLEPIGEMAERLRVAILSVTHFSKSGAGATTKALYRFIGSIALIGAPRAAFAVIEDSQRLLLHAKNNLAAPPQGLAFTLEETIVGEPGRGIVASRVRFEPDPVNVTANEALAAEFWFRRRSRCEGGCSLVPSRGAFGRPGLVERNPSASRRGGNCDAYPHEGKGLNGRGIVLGTPARKSRSGCGSSPRMPTLSQECHVKTLALLALLALLRPKTLKNQSRMPRMPTFFDCTLEDDVGTHAFPGTSEAFLDSR